MSNTNSAMSYVLKSCGQLAVQAIPLDVVLFHAYCAFLFLSHLIKGCDKCQRQQR